MVNDGIVILEDNAAPSLLISTPSYKALAKREKLSCGILPSALLLAVRLIVIFTEDF
jgi:hypothetical protein